MILFFAESVSALLPGFELDFGLVVRIDLACGKSLDSLDRQQVLPRPFL
jgi:hypothetical protein